MKKAFFSFLFLFPVIAAPAGNLTVQAVGAKGSGQVHFILFNEAHGFPGEEGNSLYANRVSAVNGRAVWNISLPSDKPYAIAAFYDVNGNGRLDRNIFGAPTEPYGFSGNVRPLFRAPSFREAAFRIDANGEVRIRLK